MADNAVTLEIQNLIERIQAIKNEAISLPADVMVAYTTDRPELLKTVQRTMTAAEVIAVLDALAGEMKLRRLYQELDALRCDVMKDVAETIAEAKETIAKARETIIKAKEALS